jgi:two-component system chemotaxis response regulator CheY
VPWNSIGACDRVQPKTILTVDDSRTIRDMLKVTLSGAGYDVCRPRTASRPWSGSRDQPAAIVTDINMPRMDGFELIEEVRRRAPTRPPRSWC